MNELGYARHKYCSVVVSPSWKSSRLRRNEFGAQRSCSRGIDATCSVPQNENPGQTIVTYRSSNCISTGCQCTPYEKTSLLPALTGLGTSEVRFTWTIFKQAKYDRVISTTQGVGTLSPLYPRQHIYVFWLTRIANGRSIQMLHRHSTAVSNSSCEASSSDSCYTDPVL